MIVQNNSATRTYNVGGVAVPPLSSKTVPDQFYDDISGIGDLVVTSGAVSGAVHKDQYPVVAEIDNVTGVIEATSEGVKFGDVASANTIVFFGDSLQAQTLYSTVPTTSYQGSYLRPSSFPFWLLELCGQRLSVVGWKAVSGSTSTQMLDWLDEVLAIRPGWVSFNAGTNDLLQGKAASAIMSDILAILAKLTSAGIRVITYTVPVLDPALVGYTTDAIRVEHRNLNHMISEEVAKYRGVYLVDAWKLGVSPTSATAAHKTGYLRADKTHFTNTYAYAVGKAAASIIDRDCPPIDRLVSSVADNSLISGQSANCIKSDNCLLTTTSGGTAGTGCTSTSATIPAGYTASRASGLSGTTIAVGTAARADGFGNDMVLTVTGDAAETGGTLQVVKSVSLVGIAPGDRYFVQCAISVDSAPVGLLAVQLVLGGYSAPLTFEVNTGLSDLATDESPYEEGWTGIRRTLELVMPATAVTALDMKVRIKVGAGASAAIRVGRISPQKVIK